jgi:hypothetical protein
VLEGVHRWVVGLEEVDEALARHSGRVLATTVDIPGVGWP